MKKRVLISYYDFGIGGSTTSLLARLNEINYDEYDVDLAVYENEGDLRQYVNPNVNIIEVKRKKINRMFMMLYSIFSLQIFFLLFDIIFTKNKKRKFVVGKTQIAAKYRAKKSRCIKNHYDYGIGYLEFWANEYMYLQKNIDKKIYWIHSDYELSGMNLIFDKKKFKSAFRIVFVADKCVDNFNDLTDNYYIDKVIKIENSLDKKTIQLMSLENIDELCFLETKYPIVSVMRMDSYTKGLDRCIEVAKIIKEKSKDIKWFFIGDGPDFEKFKLLITENDLGNILICLGKRINPYKYIKNSKLLIMLSRYEGKPMVIEEAKLLNTFCIVTEYSSARDQIENGGLILPNNDEYNSQLVAKAVINYCLFDNDL